VEIGRLGLELAHSGWANRWFSSPQSLKINGLAWLLGPLCYRVATAWPYNVRATPRVTPVQLPCSWGARTPLITPLGLHACTPLKGRAAAYPHGKGSFFIGYPLES
jgi:hypothetical protein